MFKVLILFFTLLLSFQLSFSQIVINEIVSSNISTIADEDGDYSDWIELYNSGNVTIDLDGINISDDINNLDKWTFPNKSLSAGAFILVFASGKDRKINTLHTNFKIKSTGESIYLSSADTTILDSVSAVSLLGDISYGRRTDQPEIWNYFTTATPGMENSGFGYSALIVETPQFSIQGGYFSGSLSLSLYSNSESQIRYTLDGTDPSGESPVFSVPLIINEGTVVKAQLYKENLLPGPISTRSFINNEDVLDKKLPIISISADPVQLFSESEGLFNNSPGELEKKVHIELYEQDGTLGLDANAGMKIFGNASGTGYDFQQSLALFARRIYGNGKFNYRLFNEKNIVSFESFIMRNDKGEYNIFDAVGNGLVQDILAVQAFQPVVVFINGEYWGILNMMEKINEHYVADNFKLDEDSVDVLNGFETDEPYYHTGWAIAGDVGKYAEMTDFMRENDLSADANYQTAKTMIDIAEYATYQNAEIFMANVDWPGNNTKFWRKKGENEKWRWIVFDIDAGLAAWEDDGFDATYNTLEIATEPDGPSSTIWGKESTWPNPPWSTFVLRNLLENKEFENLFIATQCDLMATNFKPEISKPWVDARADLIINEIDNHEDRWDVSGSWYIAENKDAIKDFLEIRGEHIIEHYKDFFNLSGIMKELVIYVPDRGGIVKVNNQIIKDYPFSGNYFEELELALTAIPDIGFEFVEWDGVESSDTSIEIYMSENKSLTAKFRPLPNFERVVINEICYSDSETNDWIELYNPTEITIDLSNWQLYDAGNEPFIFPKGSQLNSLEYLIVCKDIQDFKGKYSASLAIGEFEFGLSKRGDQISLYNDSGQLIDQIEYKVVYPWPVYGNSISLTDPMQDNSLSNFWQNTENRKTPGAQNDIVIPSGVSIPESLSFTLHDPYPNPFTSLTTIYYKLTREESVVINLYDSQGRLVSCLVNADHEPGTYSTRISGAELDNGVYYCVMECLEGLTTKKVVYIK